MPHSIEIDQSNEDSLQRYENLLSRSILVWENESPTSNFKPQRDLQQVDPLIPFLLTIVAKRLEGLMKKA